MDAFDENQLAGEEQYKGKLIQVTGTISNIAEDIVGNPYISLQHPTNEFALTSLKCTFKGKDAITSLKKDTTVTLQGIVEDETIGVIGLKKCSVVE